MTASIADATRAVERLSDQIRWGRSAEHPGLGDAAHQTANHLGVVLTQLRAVYADRRHELIAGATSDPEPTS